MKKLCFVTAARSEYGLLKWIMREVDDSEEFQLQLVVTGGHLLKEQGNTIDQIMKDGFSIDAKVDIHLDISTKEKIAASMGKMAEGMAYVLGDLEPDYLVVLGDRYELLPICNSAYVMGIPIIHISGGDVTEGAIDDGIRNAVTMLSAYHFPGTADSAENIRRMTGKDDNVWAVGEPGLDAFYRESLLGRTELAADLGLNMDSGWVLMTYHAETKKSLDHNLRVVRDCCEILIRETDLQIITTYSNADYGGRQINEYLESVGQENRDRIIVIPSLGNLRYLSLMKRVQFLIGNSSSGIIEAPSIGVPVINIGDRQKGRHLCSNIIQCSPSAQEISNAIREAITGKPDLSDVEYWGDGHTSSRIVSILRDQLL